MGYEDNHSMDFNRWNTHALYAQHMQVKVYSSDKLIQVSSSKVSQNLLLSLTETH